MLVYCRGLFGKVGLMSVPVRRCGFIVGNCSKWPVLGRYLFDEFWYVCRDVFGVVGLVSGRVRLGRFSFGTCSTRSV